MGQRSMQAAVRGVLRMGLKFGWLFGCLCGVASAAALSGCGASVNPTIKIPQVEVRDRGKIPGPISTSTFLYVDEFIDKRGTDVIANLQNQSVRAEGDVTPTVISALKMALTKRGFAFSDAAPIIISGELRTWRADVTSGLPSHVSAEAAVFLEVLDPANKRIYSGLYRGYAQLDEGSVDSEDVRKTLGQAMEEAVVQVASDTQLVALLSSY